MALAECKVLAALLSLVGALFLVANALPFHHHGSSRLRGPGAALADLLLAALDRLRGVDFLGLATRRNMVLLCHAILLLVLRDAGLLGTSARRRRSSSAATTDDVFVAAGACFYSPPERSPAKRSVVVWRPRNRAVAAPNAKEAAVDEIGHLKRQRRRGTRLAIAVQDRCAVPSLAEPEQGAQHESTKAIVLVEKQRTYNDAHHLLVAGELDQPAAVDGNTIPSQSDFGTVVVANDEEGNKAEEDTAEEGELPHEYGREEEDLDEINRRFEAFIADTKEKMRLEELQPAHAAGLNRRALIAY